MMTVNGFVVVITIFLFQVYTQNVIVFFICIIFIILIVMYNVVITKFNVKYQEKYNDIYTKFNATSVDFLQNIKIIKAFDSLDYSIKSKEKEYDETKKPFNKMMLFILTK